MWLEKADRHVANEIVNGHRVSTVFLGIDHGFGREGPPILFETMVFSAGTFDDQWCERCSTWEEAEAMHKRGVAFAEAQPRVEATAAMLDDVITKFRRAIE